MAEAVFKQMVAEEGLSSAISVDSAGTGSWHVGEKAHQGTRRVLQQHGIASEGRARQIAHKDVEGNTYIVAMSQANVEEFQRQFGNEYARLFRLLDFAEETEVRDVPDPYYTGNFDYVYQIVEKGCRGLLQYLREQEEELNGA